MPVQAAGVGDDHDGVAPLLDVLHQLGQVALVLLLGGFDIVEDELPSYDIPVLGDMPVGLGNLVLLVLTVVAGYPEPPGASFRHGGSV